MQEYAEDMQENRNRLYAINSIDQLIEYNLFIKDVTQKCYSCIFQCIHRVTIPYYLINIRYSVFSIDHSIVPGIDHRIDHETDL